MSRISCQCIWSTVETECCWRYYWGISWGCIRYFSRNDNEYWPDIGCGDKKCTSWISFGYGWIIMPRKCNMASLVAVEHMDPVVHYIPLYDWFWSEGRKNMLTNCQSHVIFFWWICHQMSKKVDKQGWYLFWIVLKWTSSYLFKRENKIGVKMTSTE